MSLSLLLVLTFALLLIGAGAMLLLGTAVDLVLIGPGYRPLFPTARHAAAALWLGAVLFLCGASLCARCLA